MRTYVPIRSRYTLLLSSFGPERKTERERGRDTGEWIVSRVRRTTDTKTESEPVCEKRGGQTAKDNFTDKEPVG